MTSFEKLAAAHFMIKVAEMDPLNAGLRGSVAPGINALFAAKENNSAGSGALHYLLSTLGAGLGYGLGAVPGTLAENPQLAAGGGLAGALVGGGLTSAGMAHRSNKKKKEKEEKEENERTQ